MTVAQLKATMSYQEYFDWQEYYNEEPFLADRLEWQLARIGHTNLLTGMSKVDVEQDYFLISHFEKKEEKKELSKDELNSIIENLF